MSAAGDATREAVLDAAEELLISRGVSDITTRKVADKAGVNLSTVARIEGGGLASISTLAKLAEALDVAADDLLREPPAPT